MTTQRSGSSTNKDKQRDAASKSSRTSNEGANVKAGAGTRGGSPEQHAKAGRPSHKNS